VGMFCVGGMAVLRCFRFESFKALGLFWLIFVIGICLVVMPLIYLIIIQSC